jgi:hypothetical protein
MSEFPPDQDELASAYLDGEATAAERARVEADPALRERVEQLRSVQDALTAPVPPPTTAQRDAAIAAALGATSATNVVDLRSERARRGLRIASVAAAILLVIGVAGVLLRAAGDSDTKRSAATAATANSANSATSDGLTVAEQASKAADAGGTAAAGDSSVLSAQGRPALGSFTDRSTLADAAGTQVRNSFNLDSSAQRSAASPSGSTSDGSPTTTAPSASPPTCLVPPPPDSNGEVFAATAVLEDRSVQIDVFGMTDGTFLLVVTDSTSCTQVFTQPV